MNIVNMVMFLLAGLGAFMIGFKILSDNTKLIADSGLKRLFQKTSNNALIGVGVGTVATVMLQSSSATTVMVVGFVNAGIMNLFQATSVIMGANIGTTVVAQIVALESFDFIKYAMALSCVGIFINLFSRNEKVKITGYAIAGVGLLFIGLRYMSNAMGELRQSQTVVDLLSRINNPFLLLLIGLAFTGLVQSSGATTAIIISMTSAGVMVGSGGNSVLYVILGTNIGTCVTALLSSIGANANARRAAIIHLLFNVFGTAVFMIMLLAWPGFNDNTLARLFPLVPTQIAMFHTFFNVVCALLFLPFIKVFVKLSTLLVKDKIPKKVPVTQFIDARFLATPSLALAQTDKEVVRVADMIMESLSRSVNCFCQKKDERAEILASNELCGQIICDINSYIVKISANDANFEHEVLISNLHHELIDLGRISELAENVTKYTANVLEKDLIFSENVIVDLQSMLFDLQSLFDKTMDVFKNKRPDGLIAVDSIEDSIDKKKKQLIDDHLTRVKEGTCKATSSSTFINLVSNLERAGDHLYLIAHSAI